MAGSNLDAERPGILQQEEDAGRQGKREGSVVSSRSAAHVRRKALRRSVQAEPTRSSRSLQGILSGIEFQPEDELPSRLGS